MYLGPAPWHAFVGGGASCLTLPQPCGTEQGCGEREPQRGQAFYGSWAGGPQQQAERRPPPPNSRSGGKGGDLDRTWLQQVHYGLGWNREGFLYRSAQEGKSRQRRAAKSKNPNRGRKQAAAPAAAHYEVKSGNSRLQAAQADQDGTIKDWIEVKLNSTSPLSYDNSNGEFKVTKRGLYYLYCQVHFDEGKSSYVKLDICLDQLVAFRCLDEFSATAPSIQKAQVKVCQVSGLVLLQPNSVILIKTIRDVSLKTDRFLTYFGLFQVH